jgi:cell division protein FtsB
VSERVKPYLPSAFLALMILYLGVQALTGERGLLSGPERHRLLAQREAQLASLTERRAELETRVRHLRSDRLSRDLLEERARAVLGLVDPRDVIVRVSSPGAATNRPPELS